MSEIPFNKPFIIGNELEYIEQAVNLGHLSGDGPFTKKCSIWIEQNFDTPKALITTSCTAALEMAAILIGIEPEDEVILPSFTFVSTANAFILRGAKPIWCDIREDTLNINEEKIEELITTKTKAIVVVHYAGIGCEMDKIMQIANKHGLFVIEDAAQAVNAKYKDRFLGTIGHLGCYSFHETKNFISGEGGALLINDNQFIHRAEIIREKGTNRSQVFRGEADKYTWLDIGSSYLPSELVAAFLFAQFEKAENIKSKRLTIWNYYFLKLSPLIHNYDLCLPTIPRDCEHNGHMVYVVLQSPSLRNELISYLKKRNINAVFHYIPLHTSPMGKILQPNIPSLPVTEDISSRLVRLPCYYELGTVEIDKIVDSVSQFFREVKNKKIN